MQPAVQNALPDFGSEQAAFGDLLAELEQAHRQLLAEMANLAAVTRAPQPETERFAAARWRISQASLVRRMLSATIRDALLPNVGEQEKASLKLLQEADQQLSLKSRGHVGRWTIERTCRDWFGYCEASRLIRWHMDAHIATEQRILYPILERAARRAQSA